MKIEFSDSKNDRAHLDNLIDIYNEQFAGKVEYSPFAFILKNNEDETAGGIYGWAFFEWIRIDVFIVAEEFRGQGFGQQLFNRAVQFAKEKNCSKIYLMTHDFQNKGFYLKNGFEVCGVLRDFPITGYNQYTMVREFK